MTLLTFLKQVLSQHNISLLNALIALFPLLIVPFLFSLGCGHGVFDLGKQDISCHGHLVHVILQSILSSPFSAFCINCSSTNGSRVDDQTSYTEGAKLGSA